MKRLHLALVLVLGCCISAHAADLLKRAEKTAFKGMELHSWKPTGKDWHFSLAQGTNRAKPFSEISKPENATTSVTTLKTKLATLADGEHVAWFNWASAPIPDATAKDLIAYCANLNIELYQTSLSDALPPSMRAPDAATTPSCFGIPCDFSGKLTEEQEKNVPEKLRGAFHVETVSEIGRAELDKKLKSNEKLAEEAHDGVTYIALKDFRSVHFSSGISGMMIVIERYKLLPQTRTRNPETLNRKP